MEVDSYDPGAPVPEVGSVWVWELGKPHACSLIEVAEVRWSGDEWWVRTMAVRPAPGEGPGPWYNDASRFAEAVTPVGAARWVTHRVSDGVELVVTAAGSGGGR